MILIDEDALICDLAETYKVYDYRSLPIKTVATLSCGLREDSRIFQKLTGRNCDINTMFIAGIYDNLNLLIWRQTKDGQKNQNRPDSVVAKLLGSKKENENIQTFESGKDFEEARRKILEEGGRK